MPDILNNYMLKYQISLLCSKCKLYAPELELAGLIFWLVVICVMRGRTKLHNPFVSVVSRIVPKEA